MFIRINIAARQFGKCSRDVKVLLFKSRCSCFYNIALWKYHNIVSVNKVKSAYNKCTKTFFGFGRRYSVTQMMLLELRINTILMNSRFMMES